MRPWLQKISLTYFWWQTRSKWPNCDETQTGHIVPPNKCIYQVSNWYFKAFWKKSGKHGGMDGQTAGMPDIATAWYVRFSNGCIMKTGACIFATRGGGQQCYLPPRLYGDMPTQTVIALNSSFNLLLISRVLVDKDGNCRHHVIIGIVSCLSPRGNHSCCALLIIRCSKTTHSRVDVNNTHLSKINSLDQQHWLKFQIISWAIMTEIRRKINRWSSLASAHVATS